MKTLKTKIQLLIEGEAYKYNTDNNWNKYKFEFGLELANKIPDQILSIFGEIIPKEKDKIEINHDFNDGYKIGFNEAIKEITSKLK
jgi:hypothetical protein